MLLWPTNGTSSTRCLLLSAALVLATCAAPAKGDEKPDAEKLYQQGLDLFLGRNKVAVDRREAFKLFSRAADLKHPAAIFMVADYYRFSYGVVPCDAPKAIRLNVDAEELGYAPAVVFQAQLDRPRLKAIGSDRDLKDRLDAKWEQMIRDLEAGAAKGDPIYQDALGMAYIDGLGVSEDIKRALEWFRKAAEQKWPSAYLNIGARYDLGEGARENPKTAVEWYNKAIEQDYLFATFNLARLYQLGKLGKPDEAEARRLYRRGAELGVPASQNNLGVMLINGQGGPADREEGIRWYRKAALNGHPLGIANLKLLDLNPFERPDDDKDVTATPPPKGAIVLFDGTDLNEWVQREDGRSPAHWHLIEGKAMQVAAKGDILTKRKFGGHFKLHLEYFIPKGARGEGNSGAYLQGRYEVQILDSYGKLVTRDSCGSIYNHAPTLTNACRQRGVWQSFDIEFWAPVYAGETRVRPARISVDHNGINIHYKLEILKNFTSLGIEDDPSTPGPILLQRHPGGEKVEFRNIWLQELKD